MTGNPCDEMTTEELIAWLRSVCGSQAHCDAVANRLEALVKERDERLTLHMEQLQIARTDSYSYGLRDGERIGLEKAEKALQGTLSMLRDFITQEKRDAS